MGKQKELLHCIPSELIEYRDETRKLISDFSDSLQYKQDKDFIISELEWLERKVRYTIENIRSNY